MYNAKNMYIDVAKLSNEQIKTVLHNLALTEELFIINSVELGKEMVTSVEEYSRILDINTGSSSYLINYAFVRDQLKNAKVPITLKTNGYLMNESQGIQEEEPPVIDGKKELSLRGKLRDTMFNFLVEGCNDEVLYLKTTDHLYKVDSIIESGGYFCLKLSHSRALSIRNIVSHNNHFKEIAITFNDILNGLAQNAEESFDNLVIDLSKIYSE